MNGKIWVKSELKKDTNFHFTVSLTHGKQSIKEQEETVVSSLKGLCILLVEDNRINRDLARWY